MAKSIFQSKELAEAGPARWASSLGQLRLWPLRGPPVGATRLRYSGGRGICVGTDQVLSYSRRNVNFPDVI